MKSYEMVETLSNKAHVSLEQAKDALEHSNWDILDAAIYIERHKVAPGTPPAPHPAPGPAYYVSGRQAPPPPPQGVYATRGFDRPGPFDPRFDFNKANGGAPDPNQVNGGQIPPYRPQRQREFENEPVGEFVGRLAGLLENVVNHIFRCSFVVRRHGQVICSIPLLIFIILICCFIPLVIPLIVLGAAFDCKYSLGVDPRTTKPVTDFIDQTFTTAERAKESIINETQNVRAAYEQTKKDFTEDFKKGKESVRVDLTKHDDAPKA